MTFLVTNLRLPKLSEATDFYPPSLASVFRVDPSGSTITVNPSGGIPATCVQDFLQAVDNHLLQLNNGLQYRRNQEARAHQERFEWAQKLHDHKIQQLTAAGCTCHSTYIKVNGTSKTSYQYLMGVYHFEGMYEVHILLKVNIFICMNHCCTFYLRHRGSHTFNR